MRTGIVARGECVQRQPKVRICARCHAPFAPDTRTAFCSRACANRGKTRYQFTVVRVGVPDIFDLPVYETKDEAARLATRLGPGYQVAREPPIWHDGSSGE